MAEKLFEAHLESLQKIHADATKYEESASKEMFRAQCEFGKARNALLQTTLGIPVEEMFELKFELHEKQEALKKAETEHLKAVNYLEAVKILLEAENS